MPLIQGRHNWRAAVIPVTIIDVAKYREHKTSNAPVYQGAKPFNALIDTGASSTMISPRVVAALGLQQVNRRQFAGLGGLSWRPGYLFHVAFHPPPETGVGKIQICTRVINGGELSDEHTFDVLLGMDILTTGSFHIDKDGSFRFSF
jgi:hypothetical protein